MDPQTKVSIRDFTIFQPKLLIDGLKGGAVFTMSFAAFGIDLLFLFRRHGRRRFFLRNDEGQGQVEQIVRGGDERPPPKS